MILSSGPLQGFTDDVFRFAHQKIYGGIDFYFGPYIRLEKHKTPKSSQIRDIESPLNKVINYIPQILSKDPELIVNQINHLQESGLQKVNWNLGCPYPMVTKRGMGSGLLNQATIVKEILEQIFSETKTELSIKCRLGLENDQDIFQLIEVFNDFKLTELIIHARTARQMYKGLAKPEKVVPLIEESKHPIAYNGDINSIDDFKKVHDLFDGKISHFILGRGLIANPALANEIKGIKTNEHSFNEFHNLIIEKYLERYQEHQLLPKMLAFWEYFGKQFPNSKKELKKIRKSRKWAQYLEHTQQIFHSTH